MNEILIEANMSEKAQRFLRAMAASAPAGWKVVSSVSGDARVLMTYGAGQVERKKVVDAHSARGGRLVLWDVGYFARDYFKGGMRMSIDAVHPQAVLDLAPADGSRWDALGLPLRHDVRDNGPVILVGMGPKSSIHNAGWEVAAFARLLKRCPASRIIFRPKPKRPSPWRPPCRIDGRTPIEALLKGASLVVCKHSNVALDAVLAGVPIRCEDGAAKWLDGKEYTRANRLELLQRIMWFNYRADETHLAWQMIERCLA